jgi:hypothetical protein
MQGTGLPAHALLNSGELIRIFSLFSLFHVPAIGKQNVFDCGFSFQKGEELQENG